MENMIMTISLSLLLARVLKIEDENSDVGLCACLGGLKISKKRAYGF
jgi:hypothetical protein